MSIDLRRETLESSHVRAITLGVCFVSGCNINGLMRNAVQQPFHIIYRFGQLFFGAGNPSFHVHEPGVVSSWGLAFSMWCRNINYSIYSVSFNTALRDRRLTCRFLDIIMEESFRCCAHFWNHVSNISRNSVASCGYACLKKLRRRSLWPHRCWCQLVPEAVEDYSLLIVLLSSVSRLLDV